MSTRLDTLRAEAAGCTRCPLYAHATQTVFGEGPARARLILVGEQPGDREDLSGRPFVGPAGQVLDHALEAAGVERDACYVTNAVKHFKNEPRGKRRLHKKPNAGEIAACRWWLDRELKLVRAPVLVALGATALHGLLGRATSVSSLRGRVAEANGRPLVATVHPSFLLRLPDAESRRREEGALIEDLRRAFALASAQ